ncbi:unnamed protein product [Caenorhabditis brenneri]
MASWSGPIQSGCLTSARLAQIDPPEHHLLAQHLDLHPAPGSSNWQPLPYIPREISSWNLEHFCVSRQCLLPCPILLCRFYECSSDLLDSILQSLQQVLVEILSFGLSCFHDLWVFNPGGCGMPVTLVVRNQTILMTNNLERFDVTRKQLVGYSTAYFITLVVLGITVARTAFKTLQGTNADQGILKKLTKTALTYAFVQSCRFSRPAEAAAGRDSAF